MLGCCLRWCRPLDFYPLWLLFDHLGGGALRCFPGNLGQPLERHGQQTENTPEHECQGKKHRGKHQSKKRPYEDYKPIDACNSASIHTVSSVKTSPNLAMLLPL